MKNNRLSVSLKKFDAPLHSLRYIPVKSTVVCVENRVYVGVFSWLLLCGVVGLRWGADDPRLCVCLTYFPALVPARVYRLTIASLCNGHM